MTVNEFIERVSVVAGVTGEKHNDPEVLIEVIFPRVANIIASNIANDPLQMESLRKLVLIPITSGVSDDFIDESIKEEWIPASFIESEPEASYIPRWIDFDQEDFALVGGYTIRGRRLYYRPVGGVPPTATISLSCICIPVLPNAATDQIVISPSVLEQIITMSAAVVAKQIVLPEISFDYPDLGEKQE